MSLPSGSEQTVEAYVETYYADGLWRSRRHDSDVPFASGPDELEQVALGTEVARWNQLRHIVRDTAGGNAGLIGHRS